jgi:uncharacterized membrane protein
MYREVVAGIAGFAFFNLASILLFVLSGYDPHAEVARSFQVASIVAGVVFGVISGLIIAMISPINSLRPAMVVALLVAVFAILSLLTSGSGEGWSQLAAIVLMAPAIVAGTRLRRRRIQNSVQMEEPL